MEEKENKSNIYRLDEMSEDMEKSIDNATKVRDEQIHLVDTLAELDKPEFDEFIKSVRNQITELNNQIDELNLRKNALKEVVKFCNLNTSVAVAVDKLVYALGVFKY